MFLKEEGYKFFKFQLIFHIQVIRKIDMIFIVSLASFARTIFVKNVMIF